jgi:dephospho-CoA kinase
LLHVGVTGFNAAGKGEVTEYLKRKGFKSISLSDILRIEAKNQNLEPTRENLTQLGKTMRQQLHPGFLAEKALFHIDQNEKHVIDSIRHPYEIKILKQHLRPFLLIGIDAPVAMRFERSQLRGRQENASNIDEFIAREQAEMKDNLNAQQLHKCMELCDFLIINDGSRDELEDKIDQAILAYDTTA